MTTPTTTPVFSQDLYHPGLFINLIVLFLTPYFLDITPDGRLAQADILETLQSYGARTRAELIQATRIIALSFSMLDVLAESKAIYEHPAALRLRFRNCAIALNRSTQQVEKALAARLMCDNPDKPDPISIKIPTVKFPTAKSPTAQTSAAQASTAQTSAAQASTAQASTAAARFEMSQAEAENLIQQTRAEIDTCRNRLSGVRPAHSPQPAPGRPDSDFMAIWKSRL